MRVVRADVDGVAAAVRRDLLAEERAKHVERRAFDGGIRGRVAGKLDFIDGNVRVAAERDGRVVVRRDRAGRERGTVVDRDGRTFVRRDVADGLCAARDRERRAVRDVSRR